MTGVKQLSQALKALFHLQDIFLPGSGLLHSAVFVWAAFFSLVLSLTVPMVLLTRGQNLPFIL